MVELGRFPLFGVSLSLKLFSNMIKPDKSNDIVISGVSGVFPNSENIQEFKENLLAGKDLIQTSARCGLKGECRCKLV